MAKKIPTNSFLASTYNHIIANESYCHHSLGLDQRPFLYYVSKGLGGWQNSKFNCYSANHESYQTNCFATFATKAPYKFGFCKKIFKKAKFALLLFYRVTLIYFYVVGGFKKWQFLLTLSTVFMLISHLQWVGAGWVGGSEKFQNVLT